MVFSGMEVDGDPVTLAFQIGTKVDNDSVSPPDINSFNPLVECYKTTKIKKKNPEIDIVPTF